MNTRYKVIIESVLFKSRLIDRGFNTFIPLGDETISSSLVGRGSSRMDLQPHPLLHFLVRMKPTSTNVFLQVAKNVEITERYGLYGGCWSISLQNLWSLSLTRLAVWGRALLCKRVITSDSILRRFDFMARRSTLSHQETNHTSLLLPLWSRGKIVTSYTADPVSIPCRVSLLVEVFFQGLPSTLRQMWGNLGHIRPWLSYGYHISSKPCIIHLRTATVSDHSCSTWPTNLCSSVLASISNAGRTRFTLRSPPEQ